MPEDWQMRHVKDKQGGWLKHMLAPADIKSKPNNAPNIKCPNCGTKDINDFVKPVGESYVICTKCKKPIN